MEDDDDFDASPVRPPVQIQETRIKREARRLSDWTGLPLSQSQEIAATAYGATSWQALLKHPSFVPDEHLSPFGKGVQSVRGRYADMATMLSKALGVSPLTASHLATTWQPTAMRADPTLWIYSRHDGVEDWRVLHDFGPLHPQHPGHRIVLAAVASAPHYERAEPFLLAVPVERMARYVEKTDAEVLQVSAATTALIREEWADLDTSAESSLAKRIARLSKAIKRKDAFTSFNAPPTNKPPARLKAQWLITPLPPEQIEARFAAWRPWNPADYPTIKKSHKNSFYALRTPHFEVRSSLAGHVYHGIYLPNQGNYAHSEVQAGVGGLRYLSPPDKPSAFSVNRAGYYLVKYGNQPRGHSPIPGMDKDLAAQVRLATGLGGWDDSSATFFGSDSALALASWVATFPRRAAQHGVATSYLGGWRESLVRLMEFQMARAGLLD